MKRNGTDPDPETFGAWLHDQLTRRGYDLSIRGGGRTRFSEDSGISPSTVTRLLRGTGATDTAVLEKLAATLRVPLAEILVRAGVLTKEDLAAVGTRDTTQPPMTPDDAATELGIVDERARRVFAATVEALRADDTADRAER